MADIDKKTTDLTELTTPATGDIVHIVDVSDTTDDAAGSSKKTLLSTLSTFFEGLILTATKIKTALGITILSGDNTGDETNATIKTKLSTDLPTEATGAETNTGTSQIKFVSPKAIADSDYAKTSDITFTTSSTSTVTNKTFDDELRLKQITTPANPASGYNKVYVKSDDKVYKLTSAGVESEIGAGGGSTDGWNSAGETWEFVSVDDPTGIFRVNADVTGKYSAGMRIKFTNATNVIYGIITVVGAYTGGYTSITFLHQIDPTDSLALVLMANSAITANYYSTQKAPFGFSVNPNSWTVKKTDTTARIQSTPTNDTWYNIGTTNCQLTIPIGLWEVSYVVRVDGGGTSTSLTFPKASLSTSNNSETDSTMTSGGGISINITQDFSLAHLATRSKIISLTTKTLYYLIGKVYSGGTISLQFTNDNIGMVIKATCAYL